MAEPRIGNWGERFGPSFRIVFEPMETVRFDWTDQAARDQVEEAFFENVLPLDGAEEIE